MSAAKDGPRDWDKELADIDKIIAGSPAPPPVPAKAGSGKLEAGSRQQPASSSSLQLPASSRRDTGFTWLWFLLAVLLGAGLTFLWPYDKLCGNGLYAYLGSTGLFGLASLWSTVWSWRTRKAAVHFLSIGLLFWGAFLAAREVLPRIGYAKQELTWRCPATR